jgi:CRISPR-associated protein Csb2
MFALGIEFLTGTAVMTSADSRETAEWPPHPARVFMALVAAHYETRPLPEDGAEALAVWAEERRCLEWIEQQKAPSLHFVQVPKEQRRSVVKFYVPVNDATLTAKPAGVKPAEMRSALGVMPAFRSKQERTFPAISLGIEDRRNRVHLIWHEAELPAELGPAFHCLVAKVIRVGHSSSLTMVWIAADAAIPPATFLPDSSAKASRRGISLRSIAPGFLADLDQRFNAEEINAFFELSEKIEAATGAAKKKAKDAFKERFGEDWRASVPAPLQRRPFVGVSHNYIEAQGEDAQLAFTIFDPEILVLTKLDGRVLGLESTNLLIEALRGTLLKGSEDAPAWFTGHRALNEPADSPHLALFPMAFVGNEHADGHILGLGLAFPRSISAEERGKQLKRVLFTPEGENREFVLNFGKQGTWTLHREDRSVRPVALRPETWTEVSSIWASITPVVLDRHPKHDPTDPKERENWRQEVAESISASCERIGLPRPRAVDIDKTSWHRGAPRARPGPNGMPWLPSKTGSARQQVHVLIEFDCEVEGPVLLGAGRYRGYGLCKPLGHRPK